MTNSGITRRRMLHSAAIGGVAAAAAPSVISIARAQSARKTFVLVSGTYCGGWIWRRVTDQLEQGGHKVFAPSLTGLAERSHLLSKGINLDTHIADVVNLVKWESLENVCLVAWSYAGFVSAGALESIGTRVSSIVWLEPFCRPTDRLCRTFQPRRFATPCRRLLKRARQALVRRRSLGWLLSLSVISHSYSPK